MELSAELFEQTICALKGVAATGKSDKRSNPRVGVRCRVDLAILQADGASVVRLEAWTRDISRGGVGILCPRAVPIGAKFALSLARGEGESPLALICIVRTCSALSQRMYAVGAEFHQAAAKKNQTPRQSAVASVADEKL